MLLIDQIRSDMNLARKAGNKMESALLSVVLTDAEKIGKDNGNRKTTDEEVVKVIKKIIESNEELWKICSEKNIPTISYQQENEILQRYLPKQLSEADLKVKIEEFISSNENGKNIGLVMKYLKENFPGQYDGKVASAVVKEILG